MGVTSLDACISALESEASLDEAWLSLESVFDPYDGHYRIRGSRDGLLLLAVAAIEASRDEERRVETSNLFSETGLLHERVLYVCGAEGVETPRKRDRSDAVGVAGSLSTALYLLVAMCAFVGLWGILGFMLRLTGIVA